MSTSTPQVGTPATILLYSDTTAGVVVKVNPKSIVVAKVELDESTRRVSNPGEPFPRVVVNGDVSRPIRGTEQRFMLRKDGRGYGTGSIRVRLGDSVDVTDYRY
jgi:hypothetical protein